MSTDLTQSITTADSAATEHFGEQLGRRLRGGEVIELISDLGGGKTTLTRGIARGAGSSDVVGSPTFTISKVYKAPNFNIHHFDFYRLHEAGSLEHEIADLLDDPKVVVIIEWSELVQSILPAERLVVSMHKSAHEDSRRLEYICPESLNYLLTI